MQAKVEKIDPVNKTIKLSNEARKRVVDKDLFTQKLFNVGDTIAYKIEDNKFKFQEIIETRNYPYNFVSFGDENLVERKSYFDSKGTNTGKMVCSLINKTPLFINGKTVKTDEEHPLESFLIEDGKYIIPSSSLKGEVRNIIEVLTNSCIKNVEKDRLEKRLSAGKFKPIFGIVKRLPTEKTPGLIIEAEKISLNAGLLLNLKPGMYDKKFSHYIYNFINHKIVTKEDLQKVQEKKDIEGILWVSSPIFIKYSEDTFPVDREKKLGKKGENFSPKKIIIPKKNGKTIEFSLKEYEDLDYLITQRRERDKKDGKKFYMEDLKCGDVIIYNIKDDKVVNLAFSEIPRLRYKYSPLDLVPEAFKPCKNIRNLCFSCRLFGSTGDQNEIKDKDISCIGKVYFTDAKINEKDAKMVSNYILLKPLGEPHPSLARFYLAEKTYDERVTIRGRKFYWHHKDKIGKNYTSYLESIKDEKKVKYNASLKFMKPENTFKFEVFFKNLTDEELGVLIYSLELEEKMLHKFGKAKSFGFGSCKINIEEFLLEHDNKYKSFSEIYKRADKTKFLDTAKKKYILDSRTEIEELKYILSIENDLDFRESPYPEIIKNKKKNTLNWFGKNRNIKLGKILKK